ncbi:MAG: hypothetical protein PUD43_01785, partial [Clostridia bacterium]|nr:hypothetical protein [Clostridia bacterium]
MKRSLFVSAVLIASLALPFSVSAETPLNTDINDGVLTLELSADLNRDIDDIFLDNEEINTVIIDGNGYCVDGGDETALTVYGCGNVILKDITIKTSSDESPAVLLNRPDEDCGEDCALTLKTEGNVSIENDSGRAVSISNSVKIIDSELKVEGGITAYDSD